tara:strand:- start:78 stop:605 length:528 start_codon:yes stop_codon:yes gene_type:complete
MKTINEKLATIQTQFKSKKSRFNKFGKYYFRSAEDILEATKPYLMEMGVSVTVNEELITADPFPILKSVATISDGKESIEAVAIVGVDLDQKGMQMPQRFGAASSYGKKYCLGNLFLIDDTADSDASNTHGNSLTDVKDPAFAKAKEYIKGGGKIDAIKKKYKMSKDIEDKLTTL